MDSIKNREERIVAHYLQTLGYDPSKIEPEPDGNIPPDLLIDGRIAVEVRRLNQYVITEEGRENLEQKDYWFWTRIKDAIDSFNAPAFNNSALVSLSFKRPIDRKITLESITNILREHLEIIDQRHSYSIGNSVILHFTPLKEAGLRPYTLMATSDEDSGGFIVNEIHSNMIDHIAEKEEKVRPYKEKYPIWWLAFVDTIGLGLSTLDIEQLKELPMIQTTFDRILIVSPHNPPSGVFYK